MTLNLIFDCLQINLQNFSWQIFIFLGDIGQWNPNGTLKIIDRKKHIFKLSQGEYIVPEKIENIYIKSQFVEQVFVHGESLKVRRKIFSFACTKHQDFVFLSRVVLLQL